MGRRRYLPGIYSTDRTERASCERQAVNTICQGSAADLVKQAMINIEQFFRTEKLKTRLLVQIHDELLFEIAEDELGFVQVMPRQQCSNNNH